MMCQCKTIEFVDVETNITVKLPDGSVHGTPVGDFHCTPSVTGLQGRMFEVIEQGNALMAEAAKREKASEERQAKETAEYNARVEAAEVRNRAIDDDRARYTKATERIADALDFFKAYVEKEQAKDEE